MPWNPCAEPGKSRSCPREAERNQFAGPAARAGISWSATLPPGPMLLSRCTVADRRRMVLNHRPNDDLGPAVARSSLANISRGGASLLGDQVYDFVQVWLVSPKLC